MQFAAAKHRGGKMKTASPYSYASSSALVENCWRRLVHMFSVDCRSLALFRVLFGLVIFGDLIDRWFDIEAHYTDVGAFSRSVNFEKFANTWIVSVHMMSGGTYFMHALFTIHSLLALSFTVGYKTRWMSVLLWWLCNSLQARNLIILHGGDVYMRVVLFWIMFLPLDRYFSVDAALRSHHPPSSSSARSPSSSSAPSLPGEGGFDVESLRAAPPSSSSASSSSRYTSIATVGLLVQISLVYSASALYKTAPEWTVDHTATQYAIQLDWFQMPMAPWVAAYPEMMIWMTWAVILWEAYGALTFISPVFSDWFRLFGSVGFTCLHVGFGACLRLGVFAFVGMVSPISLLPSLLWDRLVFPFLRAWPQFVCASVRYRADVPLDRIVARLLVTFFLLPECDVVPINVPSPSPSPSPSSPTSSGSSTSSTQSPRMSSTPSTTSTSTSAAFSSAPSAPPHAFTFVDHDGTAHHSFSAILAISRASPVLVFWLYPLLSTALTGRKHVSQAMSSVMYLLLKNLFGADLFLPSHRHHCHGDGACGTNSNHRTSTGVDRGATSPSRRRRSGDGSTGLLSLATVWRWFLIGLTLYSIVFMLQWNAKSLKWTEYAPRESMQWYGYATNLEQSWNMFSPHPPKQDWYYLFEAELDGGEVVDIFKDRGLYRLRDPGHLSELESYSWVKPGTIYPDIRNHRWLKYFETMNTHTEADTVRMEFGKYLCREWNSVHIAHHRLYTFKIHLMTQQINLRARKGPPSDRVIWSHYCYHKDDKKAVVSK